MKHKREEDMGRKRSFLGFLATVFMVLFTANVFAAGYVCDASKQYQTCNATYYLSDDKCLSCLEAKSTDTKDCSATQDIDNGTREYSGTQVCAGSFTGGTAGSGGTEQCTGCADNHWLDCEFSAYECNCDSGYIVVNQGTSTCSCSANAIVLDWNENGGDTVANGSCSYGGDLTLPAIPTRSDYTFTGWKLADGTVKAAGETVSGGCINTYTGSTSGTSTAITAQWSECGQCTKGTGVDSCKVDVSSNTCVATAKCSSGYKDPTCNSGLACSCTKNVFTVTVNKNGGSGSLTVNGTTATGTTNVTFSCTYGDKITMPAWGENNALTKSNSVFTGWSESSFTCTGDKTVTAQWSACTAASAGSNVSSATLNGVTNNQCQYTHVCMDGYYHSSHNIKTTSASINCSECTGLPTNAEWTGAATSDSCTWDCKACAQGSNATSCKVTKGTNSCTYTGTCEENTFNPTANGVTISCSTCPDNSVTSADNVAAECTCKQGHSVGGTQAGVKTTSSAACSPMTYNITYELNGASENYSGAPATYKYGTGATINGTPVRVGYSFGGWCTDSGLESCATSQTIDTDDLGDKKFSAKWDTCNSTTDGGCGCDKGTYPLNGVCTSCTKSCSDNSEFPNGEYYICGASPEKQDDKCYRDCTIADVEGASAVDGIMYQNGSHTCVATACGENYREQPQSNGQCVFCPANATCPDGNWYCNSGYTKVDTDKQRECVQEVYTIIFDKNGGTGGDESVQVTYGGKLPKITPPEREDYKFIGYQNLAATTQYYNGDGTPAVEVWDRDLDVTDVTAVPMATSELYAIWDRDVFYCEAGLDSNSATCPEGYYCPGEKVSKSLADDPTYGCARKCPDPDKADMTVTSPAGATTNVQCSATGNVDIYAADTTKHPNPTGTGTRTCNYDGAEAYDESCAIVPTSCIGGFWRENTTSPYCNPVGYKYYRGASEDILTRRPCSDLSGADSTTTTASEISNSPTACYNTCSAVMIANGTLSPIKSTETYDGTQIPACSYTTSCATGYSVSGSTCVPKVFKVTLNHNGGTSNTSAIYLKYANGWCADELCNTPITSVDIPVLAGQTFGGYKSGGTVVASASGVLTTNYTVFTDHATVDASWDAKPQVSCLAGTYYPGTGTECTTCPVGSFCAGGLFDQDIGVQGIETCESLNGTYTPATDADGMTMDVTISSPAGAKNASYCFATNVAYAPNQQTTGSKTCKYDTSTKSYTTGCSDETVFTCSGGYALATESAIECTIVNKGYYSPDKALTATQCPKNPDTNTYGTTEDYGATGIGMCIMDNLWFENETSGQRRKCYYSTESKKYDVNCPFSNIVTCIAGYWYDPTQSTTNCVKVGNGYYSPAQSACTGEVSQPTSAGCSTKRTSCGMDADGNQINTKDADGNITDTASSATYCEGLCEENYYCVPGEEPQACPDEYPLSAAGSDELGDCYKVCTEYKTCNTTAIKEYLKPILCESISANSCSYGGSQLTDLVTYYGTSDCVMSPKVDVAAVCPLALVTCKAGSYYEGTLSDGYCTACNFKDQYGTYTNSNMLAKGYKPTSNDGNKACYLIADLPCTEPVCPLAAEGECSDYDANATKQGGGYRYYGVEEVLPGSQKAFVCPGANWTCFEGYDLNEDANIDPTDSIADSQPDDLCTPHVYTFNLVNNADLGDYGVDGAIYQKYKDGFYADTNATTKITRVDIPVRANHTFHGYYTGSIQLAATPPLKLINADGTFANGLTPDYTSDMTLYAWWTQNDTACQVGMYYTGTGTDHDTCLEKFYCPGEGTVLIGDGQGCMKTCPEGGWTIEEGQSAITSCHKTFNEGDDADKIFDNGLATWDCTWLGSEDNGAYSKCGINIEECDAGYYNPATEKTCKSAESGYWSPKKELKQFKCAAKANYTVASDNGRIEEADCYVSCASYIPSVAHSTSVYVTPGDEHSKKYYSVADAAYPACQYTVECETGYEAISGVTPQCKSKEYIVTLDKNGGSGDIADSVRCVFGTDCTLPATNVLTRAGYNTANKWCTNADGSGVCFDAGAIVNSNISANGTDTKLYAIWTPGVFQVTLVADDADENAVQGPVYLKYETGWFSDAAATRPLTELGTDLPTKGNGAYLFAGYKIGDVSIINANGAMQMTDAALAVTTKDAVAKVAWTKGYTTCDPGYYYVGTGSQCAPCTANNYCPGGKYPTDEGRAGEVECPNEGLSAGGVTAVDISVCYKEQMAYATYVNAERTQARARGTWTCNYEIAGYTKCHEDTVEITWCAGGYWYNKAQTPIDCVEVGEGSFSPETKLDIYACPDGGNTAGATTSDALGDCQKRMDTYVSDTGNAKGTHICNAREDGDAVKYDQNCKDIRIEWCAGGYWYNADESVIDCVMVGENRFSPDGDMLPHDCPHDGTTKSTTANTAHGVCQKVTPYPGIDYTGPEVHGTGVRGCYYDSTADGRLFGTETSDGYLLNCGDITMTDCEPGYYWSSRTASVCNKVDFGYFGPVADTNNSGNMTARQPCPDNGQTQGDVSVNAMACYKEQLACDVTNGTGEQTRFYDAIAVSDTGGYNICYASTRSIDCDTVCTVTGCDTGFSLVNGACVNCPENHVCIPGAGQQTCSQATGGTHEKSDAGTENVAYCYTDCALGKNALQMTGRDYYGANVQDTCTIKVCAAGYILSDGVCVKCPAGAICDPSGGTDEPQLCATLTGGTHTESAVGSDSKDDCFKTCEPYKIENGTAMPVTNTVFWPNDCEFKGQSENGNPCDIVNGVCIETSCNYNFEMVNGVCKPCARKHAISYKQDGNCVVESCENGYHPKGQACEDDVVKCTAEHATVATQTWDASRNAFGACIITQCAEGYHLGANACQVDSQVCELEHGVGVREWNHKTNTWGECIATKCDPGYTNDRSLTNELWEQCGRCNNMYGANGELAVSSYVNGCEIAACMYQGEKYILENNECRLICDDYTDETGHRYWDKNKKKCVHDCNRDKGYIPW